MALGTYPANDGKGKAVIEQVDDRYVINLYDDNGNMFYTLDNFEGKSFHFVEDAAMNWTEGRLEVLHG